MAHQKGHFDRLWRCFLSKRVVGLVIGCALLCLVWAKAGSGGQLRKTFDSLSKQAAKSAASAASTLAGNKPGFDAQLYNATSYSTNIFAPAPFPTLPPPDYEEYMAICMAGRYLQV